MREGNVVEALQSNKQCNELINKFTNYNRKFGFILKLNQMCLPDRFVYLLIWKYGY
jgi:hypothetical protein